MTKFKVKQMVYVKEEVWGNECFLLAQIIAFAQNGCYYIRPVAGEYFWSDGLIVEPDYASKEYRNKVCVHSSRLFEKKGIELVYG